MDPRKYLRVVKERAAERGYDPTTIRLATDGTHKVEIVTPTGQVVKFGKLGYGDYILYTYAESIHEVPEGTADKKRDVFHASHEAIKGDWRSRKYSRNRLALSLLW
jgi:hypothetical protein